MRVAEALPKPGFHILSRAFLPFLELGTLISPGLSIDGFHVEMWPQECFQSDLNGPGIFTAMQIPQFTRISPQLAGTMLRSTKTMIASQRC